jgi:hypothetical protein
MNDELVQIGPFLISRAVFDFLAPLLGVLVGGLITYFTVQAAEKKWQQQKSDKLQNRSGAIAETLEWFTLHNPAMPITNSGPCRSPIPMHADR